MSLKSDIQKSIVDPHSRLSDILRKAAILAHRLKNEQFKQWVEQEMNGYRGAIAGLPEYRRLATQSFGNFSGPFGIAANNAPIPTSHLGKEILEFATTQPFPHSIRELEAMAENAQGQTIRLGWQADLVAIIADKIYSDMVCIQAWKIISPDQIEGILDTVRNRLLNFILEIEEIDADAGESGEDNPKLPPEKIEQVFNTYIMGDHNVVASGSGFSQSTEQTVMQGDIGSLRKVLKSLGVQSEDIDELSVALEKDGRRGKAEGLGTNVRNWIGNMVQKVVSGVWHVALETAPLLLHQAIASYYGWK